jgi:proton-dependent oligopeptide transporter, POT family
LADVWPNVALMGARPNIVWQFVAYVFLTVAEVLVSIVALELACSQSPQAMKSLVLAVFFLGASLGNLFTALVNSFIQNENGTSKLPGASYYWFFALLMLVTAVFYLVWIRYFHRETGAVGADAAMAKTSSAQ